MDANEFDPTKKPDYDYSKKDPIEIANPSLALELWMYRRNRSEYSSEQLARCDRIAFGRVQRTLL